MCCPFFCGVTIKKEIYSIKMYPIWFRFVYVAVCISFALLLAQILLTSALICSRISKVKLHLSLVLVCSFCFVLQVTSIAVFAAEVNTYYFETKIFIGYLVSNKLGWSFWICLASSVSTFWVLVYSSSHLIILIKKHNNFI